MSWTVSASVSGTSLITMIPGGTPRRCSKTNCPISRRPCGRWGSGLPRHRTRKPRSGRDEFLPRTQCASDFAGGSANRQYRSEQEIDGHGRIPGLHLGDARLTRANQLGYTSLRQLATDSELAQAASKSQLHFDESRLLLALSKELGGRSDPPTAGRQTGLTSTIHCEPHSKILIAIQPQLAGLDDLLRGLSAFLC